MATTEIIYQIKSSENESWIDVPKGVYDSPAKFRDRRKVVAVSDLLDKQQAAIANYYNEDNVNYYQGQIDLVKAITNN